MSRCTYVGHINGRCLDTAITGTDLCDYHAMWSAHVVVSEAQRCQFSDGSHLMDISRCTNRYIDTVVDGDGLIWRACARHLAEDGKEKEKKKMAIRDKKPAKLIWEWDMRVDKETERYRLLAIAKHTPGYEDAYVIEHLDTDSLGEPKWTVIHQWDKEKGVSNLLVGAIKSVINKEIS